MMLLTFCIFDCFQDNTADGALSVLAEQGATQPVLFRVDGNLFIKVDNSAIPLQSCSCFAEAVEYLLSCFFIFNVQYPPELKNFYSFLSYVVGCKAEHKSTTLSNFLRLLKQRRELSQIYLTSQICILLYSVEVQSLQACLGKQTLAPFFVVSLSPSLLCEAISDQTSSYKFTRVCILRSLF